jgi:hypothetical protein
MAAGVTMQILDGISVQLLSMIKGRGIEGEEIAKTVFYILLFILLWLLVFQGRNWARRVLLVLMGIRAVFFVAVYATIDFSVLWHVPIPLAELSETEIVGLRIVVMVLWAVLIISIISIIINFVSIFLLMSYDVEIFQRHKRNERLGA